MKPKLRTALYFTGAIIIAALISAGVTMQLYNQNRKDAVMLSTDEYAALTDILALDEIISDIQSDYYYDAPSREALITAAARGMVSVRSFTASRNSSAQLPLNMLMRMYPV
mgnify:CR=1 FL=1